MKKIFLIALLILTIFSCKKKQFIDEELIETGWVLTDVLDENDSIIYENIDSTNRDIYLVFTSSFEVIGHTPSYIIYGTEYTNDKNHNIKFDASGGVRIVLKYDWEAFFQVNSFKIYI